MLLIGSQALIEHGINIGRRPRDIDIIGTFDELSELTAALRGQCQVNSVPISKDKTALFCADGRIYEFEIAWSDRTASKLGPLINPDRALLKDVGTDCPAIVPDIDVLYTLKMSHRYLKNSPHFRKTRDDIMLLRDLGAKIFDEAWYKARMDETYWYKHPKLNVKKDEFFKGDGVQYVYDHDTIHVAMAHYCTRDPWFPVGTDLDAAVIDMMKKGMLKPAYTLYMKEGEQVQCSKAKFFDLPEHIRLWGVLEEACVLALERSQIPFRGKVEPRRSFDMALMKVCTSITSGWFREYSWENFHKVEALYDDRYVERFWNAVDAGIVRKLEPGETEKMY